MNKNSRDSVAFKTPIGDMSIIYRESPFIIRRILLPGNKVNESSVLLFMDASNDCSVHEKVKETVQLIRDCIGGRAVVIPWEYMLWEGVTELQKAVYFQTAEIPYGSLSTYKEIARCIGRPKACRFVGTALSKNPFPVLIPCHRVIRSDNKIGGFGGGTKLKQLLINAEASDSLLRI
ncbi:MAG: methylated-DNA--[protein]-cysteine S-methyltransferase [Desulfobacteraceae bacterium]|nr:methylated-DNA--[protein]-cysteine S-methyltransferase [Desulfobacteraceae bacterium]MBC2757337.1 methylated-DNA--[protein]-cysteine S-methyltransferase [Desulfobacteraceae bacterium]MBC2763949.1 methylated-DNA--[protein]-cysteine S-methyltransferase [ANME-2 cluster archaeon]